MKNFSIGCVVAVILLTLLAVFNPHVPDGATAAAIGAGGFFCLLIALCFYVLADIRALLSALRDSVAVVITLPPRPDEL